MKKGLEINYEFLIPGEKPIIKEIISPYNKELILNQFEEKLVKAYSLLEKNI